MLNILNTCSLRLTNVISENKQTVFLARVRKKNTIKLKHCLLENKYLILQYDLCETSLRSLLLEIEPILAVVGSGFDNRLMSRAKMILMHFIETNQWNNINSRSGWHLRLNNICLALAANQTSGRNKEGGYTLETTHKYNKR